MAHRVQRQQHNLRCFHQALLAVEVAHLLPLARLAPVGQGSFQAVVVVVVDRR